MQTLLIQTDSGGICTIHMNRPEVHNAFDSTMIIELTRALKSAEQDNNVRLVLIKGTGSSFSAGADMQWMRSLVNASEQENQRDALQLATLLRNLNYLGKPTIACINGSAYGGGVGLIAACDISVAVDHAQFGLTETRLGLVPAVISPYVIRRIGECNARRYFLTGERFDTQTAVNTGLVQQIVPAEKLDSEIDTIIRQLLQCGPQALAHAKQLAFQIAGSTIEDQKALDEYTAGLIAHLRVSAEGQEGLAAFLEKRKPHWAPD